MNGLMYYDILTFLDVTILLGATLQMKQNNVENSTCKILERYYLGNTVFTFFLFVVTDYNIHYSAQINTQFVI